MNEHYTIEEAVSALNAAGSTTAAAKLLGVDVRNFRRRLQRHGIPSPGAENEPQPASMWDNAVRQICIDNGDIIIFSDCHWHAGQKLSTANAALLRIIDNLRPAHIIGNGDLFDFAKISRHPSIGWERQPSVGEDLKIGQQRIAEIEEAGGDAAFWWDLGNHDMRFETHLAAHAPDYLGVEGFRLKDHFASRWTPAWRIDINPHLAQDGVIVKHRGPSSTKYAARNEAVRVGRSFVMGHLHASQVYRVTNANGTFYGVDAGCLADVRDDCFVNYTEASPTDWRSSFVVLSFWQGRLLEPSLCEVIDEEGRLTHFRGEVHEEAAD